MTTMHPSDIRVRHHRLHVNFWLAAVVGLAAALVALGSWVLVDRYTGPEYDAATLVDDLSPAWATGDVDAIRSLYTTDAIVVTAWGDRYAGLDQIAGAAAGTARFGFQFERIAPVTTEGDFATTFIRYSDAAGEVGTLLTVFQLDEGTIARQWDFELGVTPPFGPRAVMP